MRTGRVACSRIRTYTGTRGDQEAISLWEERERRRPEILAAVDQAEASFARGEGRRVTTHEEVAQLGVDIQRRGMTRLSAQQNALR
jgi:hypothetical protein